MYYYYFADVLFTERTFIGIEEKYKIALMLNQRNVLIQKKVCFCLHNIFLNQRKLNECFHYFFSFFFWFKEIYYRLNKIVLLISLIDFIGLKKTCKKYTSRLKAKKLLIILKVILY